MENCNFSEYSVLFKRSLTAAIKHEDIIWIYIYLHVQGNMLWVNIVLCKIIIHKISETNSSFHVKERTAGKVQCPFFMSFWLVLKKFSFWQEDCALLYNSSKLWNFPNFLRKILRSWVVRQLLRIPCLLIILTLRFTCGERKIW